MKGQVVQYNIKWEGYEETTWEPSQNIPSFIRAYYDEKGEGKVPTPKVKEVKKIGSVSYYELVWSEDASLPVWDPLKHALIDMDVVEVSEDRHCNTRKDRDKRLNRHTCGIFIG